MGDARGRLEIDPGVAYVSKPYPIEDPGPDTALPRRHDRRDKIPAAGVAEPGKMELAEIFCLVDIYGACTVWSLAGLSDMTLLCCSR